MRLAVQAPRVQVDTIVVRGGEAVGGFKSPAGRHRAPARRDPWRAVVGAVVGALAAVAAAGVPASAGAQELPTPGGVLAREVTAAELADLEALRAEARRALGGCDVRLAMRTHPDEPGLIELLAWCAERS